MIRLQVERARSLQSVLGKGWNSESDMGASGPDALKKMQDLALAQALHQKSRSYILMMRGAVDHSSKNKTPDSEKLLRILTTQEVQKAVDTNMFTGNLPIHPWDIPAVRMWYAAIRQFEGIVDAINIGFVKELGALITNKQGSVYEVKQQYIDLVEPISKNFSMLQGFIDYFGCAI